MIYTIPHPDCGVCHLSNVTQFAFVFIYFSSKAIRSIIDNLKCFYAKFRCLHRNHATLDSLSVLQQRMYSWRRCSEVTLTLEESRVSFLRGLPASCNVHASKSPSVERSSECFVSPSIVQCKRRMQTAFRPSRSLFLHKSELDHFMFLFSVRLEFVLRTLERGL